MILGIDIGVTGAIAFLHDCGKLNRVEDMPVLKDGPAGRRSINAPLLRAMLYSQETFTQAFVESVGARPGEGAVGAFAFGRSRGVIEGMLAALVIPVTFLTPAHWKRIVGIPPGSDKDAARSMAIKRWPEHAGLFARKKDEGRAEAVLIALAGLKREKTNVIPGATQVGA